MAIIKPQDGTFVQKNHFFSEKLKQEDTSRSNRE